MKIKRITIILIIIILVLLAIFFILPGIMIFSGAQMVEVDEQMGNEIVNEVEDEEENTIVRERNSYFI